MAKRRAMLGQVSLFAILALSLVAIAVLYSYSFLQESYAKQLTFERETYSHVFAMWKNQTTEYANLKYRIYECSHEKCAGKAVGSNPAWNITLCLNQKCGFAKYYNISGKVYANFTIAYANESVYLNLECLNSTGWDGCFGEG